MASTRMPGSLPTVVLLIAIAFPFLMYGLAYLAMITAERFGNVAGFAVFAAPVWAPIVAALIASKFGGEA